MFVLVKFQPKIETREVVVVTDHYKKYEFEKIKGITQKNMREIHRNQQVTTQNRVE